MLYRLRQGAVTRAENNLQCAFLIARLFGFTEITSRYLQSPLPTEIMAKGLLLATAEENEDVLAELKIKGRTVFTADVLRYALRELKTEASEYQATTAIVVRWRRTCSHNKIGRAAHLAVWRFSSCATPEASTRLTTC